MKKLPIKNASYRYLEESFREWLDVLGYSEAAQRSLPAHVRELLHYLEGEGIEDIKGLAPAHIQAHYERLKSRPNTTRGGGLSAAYLNKHAQALGKFAEYLRKAGRHEMGSIGIRPEQGDNEEAVILTVKEAQQLYEVTYDASLYESPRLSSAKLSAIQKRDRAMLTVFYGCGLRRSEGVALDVGDIDFDKSLLHVRKGKNYKERHVPLNRACLKYLENYVYNGRPELARHNRGALFVSYQYTRLGGQSHLLRLKWLQSRSGNAALAQKEVGLHSLRHSIATHLLGAGMPLQQVALFLGHASLESTQVYTHLAGVKQEAVQPFSNIHDYAPNQLHGDEL